jgi:predicted nucleic acid-binding protein
MTRVVIDTNIIVSALLQPLGPPAQVFLLAVSGSIQLCLTGEVYAEYEEVIRRPRFHACADPDDDIFLECAQAARAAYLMTGNTRHVLLPVSIAPRGRC